MRRFQLFLLALVVLLPLGQPVWAQSATYHIERLRLQAQAFLDTVTPVSPPGTDVSATVDQQLQTVQNSVWARQMVSDDVAKIITTSERLISSNLADANYEELSSAKTSLEALARRLRVSSSALTLTEQSKTALNFLMLELDESSLALDQQSEQLMAQQTQQRRRSSWGVNVGLGYGYGYGGWGSPFGWGSYYPYGNPYGPGPFYGAPFGNRYYSYPGGGYCR